MYVIRRPPVTLAGEDMSQADRAALADWIADGGDLSGTAKQRQFETALAEWLDVRHVVMVNSGASANLLMISALLDHLRNRRAVIPELGRPTTVAPLMQLGFDVHLCPCRAEDLSLDVAALETIFERERPALLLMNHILGVPGDMAAIAALCARYDVILLEDAREALGSRSIDRSGRQSNAPSGGHSDGRLLGRFGTAASFSLRSGAQLSCLQGGVVASDDEKLVQRMRILRGTLTSDVHQAGFRLHAAEVQAFLGCRRLARFDEEVAGRLRNHGIYQRELARFYQQSGEAICGPSFGTLVQNRDEVVDVLRQNRIETGVRLTCHISKLAFWQQKYGVKRSSDLGALIERTGITLPLHAGLNTVDIVRIAELFKQVAQPVMPAASTAQSVQA